MINGMNKFNNQATSLSCLGNRSEPTERASTDFLNFEAHSKAL